MTKPLIVVESPTKVRTIKRYLGDKFNVAATVGHIKDLPQKEMGIDIDKGFKPKYKTIPGKQKVVRSLKKSAADATDIYLAPDPDREGEAIAWHTTEILKQKGRQFHRVLFHELTRNAIQAAIKAPENLNRPKYEAQQTRRILDRLVGYKVSPLLWRKVKSGLSAGRVQSVAVRIICERERAIQAFTPVEYWTITAELEGEMPPSFTAALIKKDSQKIEIPDQTTATAFTNALSGQKFIIEKIQKKLVKRNPLPPFTTSKLQQEAIRKLRFSAKKTMAVAQQLYEGIDLGPGEPVGLITYMRTDSTRIAKEAADDAKVLIEERFGSNYALDKPRFFKNRKKVQDAHEAIRPTSVFNTPEKVAAFLSQNQLSLYRLVWQRFVASQMKQALIDRTAVAIKAGAFLLTANGSTIRFPGFTALYTPIDDELKSNKKKDELPKLSQGQELALRELDPKQHFTIPPPRFSEASLIRELEENGIGRPSTYASILSTIRGKGYVDLIKGHFKPSELGFLVNDLLVENFPNIFDVSFTATMENHLDRIETAEADALDILTRFYRPFDRDLETAAKQMLSLKGVGSPTDMICPECNRKIHIKVGKNGHFLACSGYPDCKYSRNYVRDEKGKIQPVEPTIKESSDQICEKCNRQMIIRQGKYGKFLSCSGFPTCKNTISLETNSTNLKTDINCPKAGCDGELAQKTSKRGKIFYGCNRYPKCEFAIWDKPVARKCPECGADFVIQKSNKKEGTFLACLKPECAFKLKIDRDDQSPHPPKVG